MASKHFLLFQYRDWKNHREQLETELDTTTGSRTAKLQQIERAGHWMDRYKRLLDDQFGTDAA